MQNEYICMVLVHGNSMVSFIRTNHFIVTRCPGDLLFSHGHVDVLCSIQVVLRGPAVSAWEADGPPSLCTYCVGGAQQ